MNSDTSRPDVAEEPLDRLRRLIETGKWQPNSFSNGDTNERLWTHSTARSLLKSRSYRSNFKYVCFFTGIVAFVLGFVFGTLLPTLLVANRSWSQNATSAAVATGGGATAAAFRSAHYANNREHRENNRTTGFDRVSFVKEKPGAESVPTGGARSGSSVIVNLKEKPLEKMRNDSIVSGVYWGDLVEAALPPGFTEEDAMQWRRYTRNVSVIQIKEGCGRMQNRLLKFSDGTISCCRYRRNTDQIQGELFSFYLGQTLGIRNLVPTTLGLVKMRDAKWSSVRSEMMFAQWAEDKPVVLTKFVPNLITAFIPFNFRSSNRRLHPTDVSYNSSEITADILQNLVELAQWSDMIVFDYLTANLDRVVNNLYNLQWNFAMMDAPTHNLRRTIRDKLLIFLDNESGLLHGYRLLDKYESYYSALLDSLCVFRKSTADVIKRLKRDGNIGDILQAAFNKYEPDFKEYLPGLPEKSVHILNERISRVFDVIEKCESMFAPGENEIVKY